MGLAIRTVVVGALLAGTSGSATFGQPYLVRDMNAEADPGDAGGRIGGTTSGVYASVGSRVFFPADDGLHGSELWVSDGTEVGTRLVKDIVPGRDGSSISEMLAVGERVFFTANDAVHGAELWVSDGSEDGTHLVADLLPGPDSGQPFGFGSMAGVLYFTLMYGPNAEELYRSDGTEQGTYIVRDINPGPQGSLGAGRPVEAGGLLYFSAHQPDTGLELWKTDGTEGGTVLVKDITPGVMSTAISNMTAYSGRLFFSAMSEGQDTAQLWTSDGTELGTYVLPLAYGGHDPHALTATANGLFLLAIESPEQEVLHRTDGTPGGTVRVRRTAVPGCWENPILAVIGGGVVMLGNDGVTGCEPWYSDGTPTGTGLLRDIRPGAEDSLLSGGDFVSVPERGLVFFDATDAYANYELWRTDGTRTGTEAVSNFAPMYAVGLPMPGNAGGTMFVSADDGVHGLELWKSDGTAEGTVLVKDIRPALANGNSDPAKMIQVGNRVFLQATDTTHGTELWLTDGLAGGAGTGLVKDIYAGNRSSLAWYRPSNARSRAAAMGSTLIFAASDNYTGSEIWKSDGTAAGTVQIKDIVPGSSGSDPDDLVGLD